MQQWCAKQNDERVDITSISSSVHATTVPPPSPSRRAGDKPRGSCMWVAGTGLDGAVCRFVLVCVEVEVDTSDKVTRGAVLDRCAAHLIGVWQHSRNGMDDDLMARGDATSVSIQQYRRHAKGTISCRMCVGVGRAGIYPGTPGDTHLVYI